MKRVVDRCFSCRASSRRISLRLQIASEQLPDLEARINEYQGG